MLGSLASELKLGGYEGQESKLKQKHKKKALFLQVKSEVGRSVDKLTSCSSDRERFFY